MPQGLQTLSSSFMCSSQCCQDLNAYFCLNKSRNCFQSWHYPIGLMVAASGVRLKEMNNLLFTHVFAIFAVILFRIVCLMQYSQTLTLYKFKLYHKSVILGT